MPGVDVRSLVWSLPAGGKFQSLRGDEAECGGFDHRVGLDPARLVVKQSGERPRTRDRYGGRNGVAHAVFVLSVKARPIACREVSTHISIVFVGSADGSNRPTEEQPSIAVPPNESCKIHLRILKHVPCSEILCMTRSDHRKIG